MIKEKLLNCGCDAKTVWGKWLQRGGLAGSALLAFSAISPILFPLPKNIPDEVLFELNSKPGSLCGAPLIIEEAQQQSAISNNTHDVNWLAENSELAGLISCGVIIGGFLVSRRLANAGRADLGRIVKGSSAAIGMGVSLPAAMHGVTHLGKVALAVSDNMDAIPAFEEFMGSHGHDMQAHNNAGLVASSLLPHLGCVATAAAAASAWISTFLKCGKPVAEPEVVAWQRKVKQTEVKNEAVVNI